MRRLGTTRNTCGFIFAVASTARFRGFHGSKKRWKTPIGTGAVWLSVRRKDCSQAFTDAARQSGRSYNTRKFRKKLGGAAGITTATPRIAGQWGRGDNRLP
jgi:hypothetical protein